MKFVLKVCVSAAMGVWAAYAMAQQPTIKIAHIDTFSGPTASTGATIAKTMLYAVDLVNQRGGVLGQKLEVVPMDNGGDPTKAIALLSSVVGQKFI